jgi:molybdate transport system substrate-binding protein
MKRRSFVALFWVGLLFSVLIAACVPQNADEVITVSAAASLQEVLAAISPTFTTAHPNISVSYNFGSSGALQQQIEQGAPADVFISAATKQMDALSAKGLILPNSRQNLVTNRLVLIAPVASQLAITDLAQLKTADISHFAIGEFRSVPAGQYAEEALKKLALFDALKSKFVFGNSVRGVLSAVESGNAEVGIVYATDAALSDRVRVVVSIPPSAHSPIVYPIAAVKSTPHAEAAETFIRFLKAEAAQEIFEEFGFGKA